MVSKYLSCGHVTIRIAVNTRYLLEKRTISRIVKMLNERFGHLWFSYEYDKPDMSWIIYGNYQYAASKEDALYQSYMNQCCSLLWKKNMFNFYFDTIHERTTSK